MQNSERKRIILFVVIANVITGSDFARLGGCSYRLLQTGPSGKGQRTNSMYGFNCNFNKTMVDLVKIDLILRFTCFSFSCNCSAVISLLSMIIVVFKIIIIDTTDASRIVDFTRNCPAKFGAENY